MLAASLLAPIMLAGAGAWWLYISTVEAILTHA